VKRRRSGEDRARFVADWIAKRREGGLDWKNDESRHPVLPELGDLPLAEVRARHAVDLFHKLRTDRARNLAQRTIYNIYTVVAALFRDTKLADLIAPRAWWTEIPAQVRNNSGPAARCPGQLDQDLLVERQHGIT
jgi:hypothetical protein